MQRGNILDTYVDDKNNVMVTWLIDRGIARRIEEPFFPSFYVHASQQSLFSLAAQLQDSPQVKALNFTKEKLTVGSEKKTLVLEVTPSTLSSFHRLAAQIDLQGNYREYTLYNVDFRLPTRYLQQKGVFCNAWVVWDGKNFTLNDDQWAIDYEIPAYKILRLEIKRNPGFSSFADPITSFVIDGEPIQQDDEVETIRTALALIKEKDPDLLYTRQGDSFLLPYLYHRAAECGISKDINLGRDRATRKRPVKQEKSYFSYGQIVYRPGFYTLQGRVHIDQGSSFFYGESNLRGILDVSRCANIPLQLLSRLGPGTAISQMQVNAAMSHGYLIPWKKNMPEQCKTARQLLVSDRGGLILSPVVGLHEDVVELDFASLYPTIMLKFNISPETMQCECCPDSPIRVPQLGYHICTKNVGLLPEVLKPILYRRFCLKARAKNPRYDPVICKEMQQAWKWVLVVCFGYTGYRNARFGRIECHESITAFARDILLEAVAVAEQAGYSVLHGIIDSLWVKTATATVTASQLARMIGERTGIRMGVEGTYHWIVFLPSKQTKVGALTRYYGVFENGEVKVRGIELRQRNTPEFLREVQRQVLSVLQQARTAEEFEACLPQAVDALLTSGKPVVDGTVNVRSLVFHTKASRDISEYHVQTFVKAALLQLRDHDIIVKPGQSVQYLVTDEQSLDYRRRVRVAEALTGSEQVDVGYYLRQIAKCGESILLPFGYSKEHLEVLLHQHYGGRVRHGSILPRIGIDTPCF